MINRPNNWNEVKEFADYPKLPLGAYVCKVKKAVVQPTDYGDQLCILFDICEGDFRNFYDNEFKANTKEDKKWKGVLRQWLPKDDGSEKDEWTKSSLKGMTSAFEKSNPGYQWNWNETSLVGKVIGIIFRNEEWDYNGKHGWAVRPFRACDAELVRSNEYKLPADKPLKTKAAASDSFGSYGSYAAPNDFEVIPEPDDNDLPF